MRPWRIPTLMIFSMFLLALLPGCSANGETANPAELQTLSSSASGEQQRVKAPELPGGMQWLNTTEPLSLEQLRGKVVLLDFWTYCCINCIHIIPDLKKLEEKYADELVVIGVHSAKFTTEQETENIRQAVLRYEIEHPVVNDKDMRIWRTYGARAWPTLFLIDPEGYAVAYSSGEGVFRLYDQRIADLIETFDREGKIDRSPIAAIVPEAESERRALLNYPGKVLADGDRLFIADSNHNRIVLVNRRTAMVEHIIGSGETGLTDGSYREAAFNKPQGMTVDGHKLYVADTENHAVRLVDLDAQTVTTIAGTGEQGPPMFIDPMKEILRADLVKPAGTTPLSNPWDLQLIGSSLFVANAGTHQLFRIDLKAGTVEPHAGSAREDRTDGPLLRAALAQPSGLTTDGMKLYFADSEVSAIRSASVTQEGTVNTVAGGELFEFGDIDAKGLKARFQHPLGVAYKDGWIYIADTYNNKIRRVNVKSRQVESYLGSGEPGAKDGAGDEATFDEPGGVSIAGNTLYIADTNNHLIRVADMQTRQVSTLVKGNMERLTEQAPMLSKREPVELEAQSIASGSATVQVIIQLPAGLKLNDLAPSAITWQLGDGEVVRTEIDSREVTLPLGELTEDTMLRLDYDIYYCTDDNEGLCYFGSGSRSLALLVTAAGSSSTVTVAVAPDAS